MFPQHSASVECTEDFHVTGYLYNRYLIVPRGFEQAPESIEKRGFSADPAQKASQNGQENELDANKLSEMLRMIPAEKQAEFLRSLADYMDNNRKPSK